VARCLNQIKAISIIHEMLSCEQDVGMVGLKDTVDRIAGMAAVAASAGKNVSVEVDGDNTCVPSKYASAVGIAVNELVSNAIEHGLAARDSGHIEIRIRSSERTTEIVVRDNGVGLPEGFTLDGLDGSGLGVLSLLLKQGLGGTLQLASDNGTVARISFSR
jgi:two-component sensor histidine kinase